MAAVDPGKEERSARLDLRLPSSTKETIARAASLLGVTNSDFVTSAAYREAVRTIREHEMIQLNRAETERFVESFLNPPVPNGELTRLVKEEA